MSADIRFGWIDLVMGDSLRFRMGNSTANFALTPSPEDKKLPDVKQQKVNMDSLRSELRIVTLANASLIFRGSDRKINVSHRQWGSRLQNVECTFPLRMRMPGTKITLSPGHIKLNGAKLKMGRSDLFVNRGSVQSGGCILRQEDLKANLVRSNMINCNQLMKAMEVGAANRMV